MQFDRAFEGEFHSIRIGVADEHASMNRFLGEDEHGWSYWCDDGFTYHARNQVRFYGPKVGPGDYVDVVVDMPAGSISFFATLKDSQHVHYIGTFNEVPTSRPLFVAVSVCKNHAGDSIQVSPLSHAQIEHRVHLMPINTASLYNYTASLYNYTQ